MDTLLILASVVLFWGLVILVFTVGYGIVNWGEVGRTGNAGPTGDIGTMGKQGPAITTVYRACTQVSTVTVNIPFPAINEGEFSDQNTMYFDVTLIASVGTDGLAMTVSIFNDNSVFVPENTLTCSFTKANILSYIVFRVAKRSDNNSLVITVLDTEGINFQSANIENPVLVTGVDYTKSLWLELSTPDPVDVKARITHLPERHGFI